jgi:hypothetical protein
MSWVNGNGFLPHETLAGTRPSRLDGGTAGAGTFPQGSPGNRAPGVSADAYRPAWFGGGTDPLAAFGSTFPGGAPNVSSGGMAGILAQLESRVQQYIGRLSSALLGTSPAARGAAAAAQGAAATFAGVSLASVGDPHLSVTGTQQHADGTTANVDSHFDSMTAHQNLFSTNDFGDGFNVSTTVTQPSANGVTQNASATASMDFGRETVTMTNAGALSVIDHGQVVGLAAGQSVTLSGGQRVSEAANGAVTIAETSFGENLSTTFTPTGGGVDVTASGQNVTLAGDLITGGTTPVAQPIADVRHPLPRI